MGNRVGGTIITGRDDVSRARQAMDQLRVAQHRTETKLVRAEIGARSPAASSVGLARDIRV